MVLFIFCTIVRPFVNRFGESNSNWSHSRLAHPCHQPRVTRLARIRLTSAGSVFAKLRPDFAARGILGAMHLDRDYRPRRRGGWLGKLWPLFILFVVAVVLFEMQPNWLAPRQTLPTPTPTLSIVTFLADAQASLSRGDYGAAIAAYTQVARLQPENPEPLVIVSQLHMINQDIAAAHETASRAVTVAPQDAAALTALARAEDWLGNFEDALSHALDAYEIDPNNVETLAVLGEIYTDVGGTDTAREYIDQALALDPQNILAIRNDAYLFERLGKYEEALAALDRALAIQPQRPDLYMEKARIYRVGLADYANALVAYRAAVDANKTAVTLDALGEGLYNAGDYLQAVRTLRQALELDPDYGPALVHMGMALYSRRNYEDAAVSLERGLAIIGDAREEHYFTAGLSYIYKEPRECDLAEPWLRKALEKNPDSSAAQAGLRICSGQPAPTATP